MKAVLTVLLALSFVGCGQSSSNNSSPVIVGPNGGPSLENMRDDLGESSTVPLRGREKQAIYQTLTDYGRILYLVKETQRRNDSNRESGGEGSRGRPRIVAESAAEISLDLQKNFFVNEGLAQSVLSELNSPRCSPQVFRPDNSSLRFSTGGRLCPLQIQLQTKGQSSQDASVRELGGTTTLQFSSLSGSRLELEDIKSGDLKINFNAKSQSYGNNDVKNFWSLDKSANLLSANLGAAQYTLKTQMASFIKGRSIEYWSYTQIRVVAPRLTAVLTLTEKRSSAGETSLICSLNKEFLSPEQCLEINSMVGARAVF